MSEAIKILIVEDEHIVARDLQKRLEKMNYQVSGLASTYDQTIASIEENKPDLVLMDIHIRGEKDGVETASEVLSSYDIPLIYLTAYADKKTLERAKKTQPLGYLLKPFEEQELETSIEMALYKHSIQKQLVKSERFLATTLRSIGDAIITTDADKRVLYLNPVAEQLTGWKCNEATKRNIEEVLRITDEYDKPLSELLEPQRFNHTRNNTFENLILLNKAGEKIPIDVTAATITDEDLHRGGFVLVFKDMSERRKNELRLQEGLRIEQALTEVSSEFVTESKPDLSRILKILGEALYVDRSYIFSITKDGKLMSNNYEWCDKGISPQKDSLQNISTEVFPWWFKQLSADKNILISDVDSIAETAPEECAILQQQNIKSAIVVPFINMKGELTGFMGFDDTTISRAWLDRDIQVLRLVSEMIINYMARANAEKALKKSEERFRNLIQSSYDIISIVNHRGIISYQSPSVKNVLGYKPSELIGQRLLKFVHPNDKRDVVENFQDFISGKSPRLTIEYRLLSKDDDWVFLETYGTFLTKKDQSSEIVLNSRDISDRRKTEDELRKAKNKAEEMNRLKTTFLANMSHEIRTPLTGIMGFASILESELKDEEQQEMAQRIHTSGKRLLDTIDAILDLAKIEANKINMNLEAVEVISEVQTAIRLLQPLARSKDLEIEFKKESEKVTALLDKQLLGQILNNLIGNAIKYTPTGTISIRTGILPYFTSPKIFIEVEDTGLGISEDFLPLIFDEFRQESQGLSRKFEGSGLGLTITKKLTELMQGEISVQSQKEIGSIFTLVFPAIDYEDYLIVEGSGSDAEQKPLRAYDKFSLLLCDDNKDSREVTNRFLRDSFDIDEASTGEQALEMVQENKYDVVLMDINLGRGMNGNTAMKEIKKLSSYQSTPVIALTAYAMKGDRDYFLDVGFDDYISKPFRRYDILNAIIQHVV